jgi:anti-anti-sigma regulatory factor
VTEQLLKSIRSNRARVVVMDVTGVATLDTVVANHLVLAAKGAVVERVTLGDIVFFLARENGHA